MSDEPVFVESAEGAAQRMIKQLKEKDKEIERLKEEVSKQHVSYLLTVDSISKDRDSINESLRIVRERRDTLTADNQRLRDALEEIDGSNVNDPDFLRYLAKQALAATAQDSVSIKSTDGTFDDGYVFGKPSPETFKKCAEEIQNIFRDGKSAQGDNERKP